ncbi:LacI family DNA-binding transcriptional regulator [Actinophytocola sp.]|uniref:LacI family DNA-binding transcriptional regulator n=1 Tax=Actinophytocola sp. TaxID=1872138 RepID=UPI002D7EAB5F|nr:LacI family DNA-binding transcriptional regulator [Actinophytocola sp.]HET9140072.1 LacI family DNA-binding transcriptional regulator [Actinophytocola sp.]
MAKIDDVARHAGVAPSTVSYVLSGKRAISEETRQRVLKSIRVLGYQPHAGARALASNRSNVLALFIPLHAGIHVPVIMQFVVSVVTTARQFDHDVLLLTQDEGVKGLERVANTSLVDGLIVMDIELQDPRLPVLRSLRRPSVLIGVPDDPDDFHCIDLDFTAAGAKCLDHLADLGHRRVALIGSPPEVYKRETGYATRLSAGFKVAASRRKVAATVHPCGSSNLDASLVASEVFEDHPDTTALVVHNEDAVDGLMRWLGRNGRRVPEDVSIVAICPDEIAHRVNPPLTSVAIPAEEIGEEAVRTVMAMVEGGVMDELGGSTTLIGPRLTVRDSTAPPKP